MTKPKFEDARDDANDTSWNELEKPTISAQDYWPCFETGANWARAWTLRNETEVIDLIFTAHGCSDGNCILRDRNGGQHTNGGCRCKRNMRDAIANFEKLLKRLEGYK